MEVKKRPNTYRKAIILDYTFGVQVEYSATV